MPELAEGGAGVGRGQLAEGVEDLSEVMCDVMSIKLSDGEVI